MGGKVYLRIFPTGFETEGIGSATQDVLSYYGVSKILGMGFLCENFSGLNHYQYNGVTQQQFCSDCDTFFGFLKKESAEEDCLNLVCPIINENFFEFVQNYSGSFKKDCIIDIDNRSGIVTEFFRANLHSIENFDIIGDIKDNLVIPDVFKYFSDEEINIAIHIRVFNSIDFDRDSNREIFNSEKNQDYVRLIEDILDSLKDVNVGKNFHIYSQGSKDDFKFLEEISKDKAKIFLHIDEYPLVSLYHLCKSDILVMANSSFSYISSLIGNQITLVRDNFWHPTFSNKRVNLSSEYKFDKDRLYDLVKNIKKLNL